MRNFYTEIENNKSKTLFIVVGFFAFIALLAYFASLYFGKSSFPFFLGIGLVISGISSIVSYYHSDKIVLSISGAKELDRNENPEIYRMVENLSRIANIPTPKVFKIEDTAMNAFATGRNPENGVICFTTGIMSRLDLKELEGVAAHEIAHIGNHDIKLASIVSVLVGLVVLLSDFLTHGMFYSSNSDEGREISPLTIAFLVFAAISAPIVATIIQLSLSRNREYLADATAASLTGNPNGLAKALEKISGDTEILEAANGATAHLYFSNPLSNSSSFLANLFSTHPPVEERIKRLREM